MMTLGRCFTSPSYVREELSSFSVPTTAAIFLHSWPHCGFTRRPRDFNALQGNLQFGTGTVQFYRGAPLESRILKHSGRTLKSAPVYLMLFLIGCLSTRWYIERQLHF